MAPAQFLMRYRIGEAAAMLRNTGLAIGEIAASVGFRDPLYFSRVFKRIKGVSPREYGRERTCIFSLEPPIILKMERSSFKSSSKIFTIIR